MTHTRLPTPAPDTPDLAPDRMALIAEWTTETDERLELYTDDRQGDGVLVEVPVDAPAYRAATVLHSSGVVRSVEWKTETHPHRWRETQGLRIRAEVAARWAA